MDKTLDEKTLHAAADWWTRLREPDGAAETLEQWLAWTSADARHLAAFERVSEFGQRLGRLDDFTRRQLVREFARPVVAAPRRWLPFAAAASSVLVLLGGWLAWNRPDLGEASRTYASAVAQNRDITLSDGTTVALGGASTLITHFSRGERRVELEGGEAFFQVRHDAQRPFVVTAGKLSIRDVGTAFDVRRTGQRVTVAITQGRVRIADNTGTSVAGTNALDAMAGQRVSYDPASPAMSVGSITSAQATAWRNDQLDFIDEPLGVVVANLNRYSARPVHIADANLDTLIFTGTIRTDAIDSWLGALPRVFPLRVSEDAHRVVLSNAEHLQGR